jgi:hypothetical protein
MADTVVAAAAGSPAVAVSELDHPVARWAPVEAL